MIAFEPQLVAPSKRKEVMESFVALTEATLSDNSSRRVFELATDRNSKSCTVTKPPLIILNNFFYFASYIIDFTFYLESI